ncbi:hypothetical protein PTSG_05802 [Salpingoeca rosetta]|uniref:PDZ domain-containing protein n=1 Tax=Salpingoeca rosetta (strain ATCC 50818 / BSB-021) TaxID=946362 RepID=F2UCU2_SALR5|nr:uncharacterized protein PTSG_05802 [Salpingoeca rosetta]EGD74437.1 hypothetical protein PTSG_05802 [Salpingoeca rosetta]|eukprot:XP_004992694.1 hypothetical protein PTSG_05802 [Salpingoeca rosetta]
MPVHAWGTGENDAQPPEFNVIHVTVHRSREYAFGFTLGSTAEKLHVVSSVTAAGPAFGLLQEGDIVEAINGITTANLSHRAVPRMIGSKKVLNLRLRRPLDSGQTSSPASSASSSAATVSDTSRPRSSRLNFIAQSGPIGTPARSIVDELKLRYTPQQYNSPASDAAGPPEFAETPLPGTAPQPTGDDNTAAGASGDEIVPVQRRLDGNAAAPAPAMQTPRSAVRSDRLPPLNFSQEESSLLNTSADASHAQRSRMDLSPITPASTVSAMRSQPTAARRRSSQLATSTPQTAAAPATTTTVSDAPVTSAASAPTSTMPTSGPIESVFIQRVAGQRLGLRVVGGLDTQLMAVFVDGITENSAAAASNIQYGDRLLAADGVSLLNQSRDRVVDILRGAGSTLTLVVQHIGADQWHDIKAEAAYRVEMRHPHAFAVRELVLPLLSSEPTATCTRGEVKTVTLSTDDDWVQVSGGCGSVLGGFFVTRVGDGAGAPIAVGHRVIDVNQRSFVLSKMWDLQQLAENLATPVHLTVQVVDTQQWARICDAAEFDLVADTRNSAFVGGAAKLRPQHDQQQRQQRMSVASTASSTPSGHPLTSMLFPAPPPPSSSSRTSPRRASRETAVVSMNGGVRTVQLTRTEDGTFGFTLIGPSDPAQRNSHVEGVYVKELTCAEPIEAGLFIGDRILAINEHDVTSELANAVIDRIASLDRMTLAVENSPRALALLEVERRKAGEPRLVTVTNIRRYGLGIDLLASLDATASDLDNSSSGTVGPAYVAAVDPSGAIGRDGRIKAADQILMIDGQRVQSPQHADRLLSTNRDTMSLVVRISDAGYDAVRQALLHTTLDTELAGPIRTFQLPDTDKLGLILAGGSDTAFCGVFVQGVKPNSPAAELGIVAGDLVLSLDDAGMLRRSRADMVETFHRNARGAQLRVMRLGAGLWNKYQAVCSRTGMARPNLPPTTLPLTKGTRTSLSSTGPILAVDVYREPNQPFGLKLIGGVQQGMDTFFVTGVEQEGPCFGFIQPGDRILEVNNHALVGASMQDLLRLIGATATALEVVVQRTGREQWEDIKTTMDNIDIQLQEQQQQQQQEQQQQQASATSPPAAKVLKRTLSREKGRLGLGIATVPGAGTRIGAVDSDTARRLGLKEGQEIVAINGRDISGLAHEDVLRLLHEANESVQIEVREAEPQHVQVQRFDGRFGFTVMTTKQNEDGSGCNGLYVHTVTNPTTALKPGMRIIGMCGEDMHDADSARFQRLLMAVTGDEIVLDVLPPLPSAPSSRPQSAAHDASRARLQSHAGANWKDMEVLTFTLERSSGRLGLAVAAHLTEGRFGVFVASVSNANARERGVRRGMRLLAVNGTDVQRATRDQAVTALKKATEPIIIKCAMLPHTRNVVVHTKDITARSSPFRLQSTPGVMTPVFLVLKEDQTNATAQLDGVHGGAITAGDRILFIGDESAILASQEQVNGMLAEAGKAVTLMVARDKDMWRLFEPSAAAAPARTLSTPSQSPSPSPRRGTSLRKRIFSLSRKKTNRSGTVTVRAKRIRLRRIDGKFGVTVAGDTSRRGRGVFVAGVKNLDAEKQGLARGMRIMEADGVDTTQSTQTQVLDIFSNAEDTIVLQVIRDVHGFAEFEAGLSRHASTRPTPATTPVRSPAPGSSRLPSQTDSVFESEGAAASTSTATSTHKRIIVRRQEGRLGLGIVGESTARGFGVYISNVANTDAAAQGLVAGMRIMTVDGEDVRELSQGDVLQKLGSKRGDEVVLGVIGDDGGYSRFVEVASTQTSGTPSVSESQGRAAAGLASVTEEAEESDDDDDDDDDGDVARAEQKAVQEKAQMQHEESRTVENQQQPEQQAAAAANVEEENANEAEEQRHAQEHERQQPSQQHPQQEDQQEEMEREQDEVEVEVEPLPVAEAAVRQAVPIAAIAEEDEHEHEDHHDEVQASDEADEDGSSDSDSGDDEDAQRIVVRRQDGRLGLGLVGESMARGYGVYISNVANTDAAAQGLEVGMRVLSVDGHDTRDATQSEVLSLVTSNDHDEVIFTVIPDDGGFAKFAHASSLPGSAAATPRRQSKEETAAADVSHEHPDLVKQPAMDMSLYSRRQSSVNVQPITVRRQEGRLGLGIVGESTARGFGVYISNVANTDAAAQGLVAGMRIMTVDGEDVRELSQGDVLQKLGSKRGDEVVLGVIGDDGGYSRFVEVASAQTSGTPSVSESQGRAAAGLASVTEEAEESDDDDDDDDDGDVARAEREQHQEEQEQEQEEDWGEENEGEPDRGQQDRHEDQDRDQHQKQEKHQGQEEVEQEHRQEEEVAVVAEAAVRQSEPIAAIAEEAEEQQEQQGQQRHDESSDDATERREVGEHDTGNGSSADVADAAADDDEDIDDDEGFQRVVVRRQDGRLGLGIVGESTARGYGVYISNVANTDAAAQGLVAGMRIMTVDGEDVRELSQGDVLQKLGSKRGDEVVLGVIGDDGGYSRFVEVASAQTSGTPSVSDRGRVGAHDSDFHHEHQPLPEERESAASSSDDDYEDGSLADSGVQRIVVRRQNGRLGLGLVGESMARGYGVYISNVANTDAAAQGLEVGMRVLSVDGHDTRDATQSEVLSLVTSNDHDEVIFTVIPDDGGFSRFGTPTSPVRAPQQQQEHQQQQSDAAAARDGDTNDEEETVPDAPPALVECDVTRTDGRLGIGLLGHPTQQGLGVYLCSVTNPVAIAAGMKKGLRLVQVNDKDLTSATQREAFSILTTATEPVHLAARVDTDGYARIQGLADNADAGTKTHGTPQPVPPSLPIRVLNVDVEKDRGRLGCAIVVHGQSVKNTYINSAHPRHAGRVQPGDCVVAVNGEVIVGKSQNVVVGLIQAAGDVLRFTIARCPNVSLPVRDGSFQFDVTAAPTAARVSMPSADVAAVAFEDIGSGAPTVAKDHTPLRRGDVVAAIDSNMLVDSTSSDVTALAAQSGRARTTFTVCRVGAEVPASPSPSAAGRSNTDAASQQQSSPAEGAQDNANDDDDGNNASTNANINDTDTDSAEPDTAVIVLHKGSQGFGFVLKAKDKPGPLTVGRVREGGAASNEPRLKKGVRVLSINGTDTSVVTKQDAGRLISRAGDTMELKIVLDSSTA